MNKREALRRIKDGEQALDRVWVVEVLPGLPPRYNPRDLQLRIRKGVKLAKDCCMTDYLLVKMKGERSDNTYHVSQVFDHRPTTDEIRKYVTDGINKILLENNKMIEFIKDENVYYQSVISRVADMKEIREGKL